MYKAELLLESVADLAEGPVWDTEKQLLHWVDIDGCLLHTYNPKNGEDTALTTPKRVGMVALDVQGRFIAGLADGLYLIEPDGNCSVLKHMISDPELRFNDGKPDAAGRIWVGSMSMAGKNNGCLYCVNTDGVVRVMENNISCSNGLAWSLCNKYLYYIDTPSKYLWRYDYDIISGNIENRTPIIDYTNEKGGFDGMTIDSDGTLWIAQWGGFCVSRYDPLNGKKIDVIELPAPCVSSCEFGGENLDTLFITVAGGGNKSIKKEHPLSGSLFAVSTDVKGLPCNRAALKI